MLVDTPQKLTTKWLPASVPDAIAYSLVVCSSFGKTKFCHGFASHSYLIKRSQGQKFATDCVLDSKPRKQEKVNLSSLRLLT